MQLENIRKQGCASMAKAGTIMTSVMTALSLTYMQVMATTTNPFSGANTAISDIVGYAKDMMLGLIIPLAALACLIAVAVMYLPGQSSKVTEKCKSVIWSCIATVALSYALTGIFNIAKTIGESIV